MSKTSFDNEFKILGYKTGREITIVDDDLLSFKNSFDKSILNTKSNRWFYNRKKIIKETENFFNQFLRLNKVRYISNKDLKRIELKINCLNIDKDIVDMELKSSLKILDVFDLPIFTKDYSALEPFFTDKEVYLTGISIESKNSKDILCDYSHEIIHSQLYSQKGSVLNYKNSEVLSIFFEFISALYSEKSGLILNNILKQRCENTIRLINLLIVNINDMEMKLHFSSYIESSLIAMKLFDIYMKGDDLIKKEIMHDIQNIIDGKSNLEEMLDKYDAVYESSKQENIFKKYIK